jgi:hypothetical protein
VKLTAAAVVVAAAGFLLPAAQAVERKGASPVLGLDVTRTGVIRLAWFDPSTLTTLRGRKARLGRYTESWSFSPDRSLLAIAVAQTTGYQGRHLLKLRFVDARRMRVLGELGLGEWQVDTVTWLRAGRLLAVVRGDTASIAVVDPIARSVIRMTPLPRLPWDAERLTNGLTLLLGSEGSFAPAVLAVVDAEGVVRTVTLDRISIGTVVDDQGKVEVRGPGFTVDPATHRAFVVGADFTVAEVDLDTLRVAYHGGSLRSLAKSLYGSERSAVWLGRGLLAVAGSDYSGDETTGQAVGLRLIDTRGWSSRVVDSNVGRVWRASDDPMFFATGAGPTQKFDVYDMDGRLSYHLDLADDEWLNVQGPYGYVCSRTDRVMRVLSVSDGTSAVRMVASHPACPTLLFGPSG